MSEQGKNERSGAQVLTRRRLLALLGASTASAAVVTGRAAQEEQGTGQSQPKGDGCRRFGMAIDLDRCLRCQACVVACAAENNVPPLGWKRAALTRPIHWMDMLAPGADGRSELGPWPAPIPCMHCDRPECERVCPVGATYRSDEGVVAQIWERCIGCRYCMVVCPYSRRYYNWTRPEWPGGDTSCANPDVGIRPEGVVEKCTFCQHRIRATVERARLETQTLSDQDFVHLPACAEACPTHAITFGDLADPTSTVAELAKSPRAIRLLDALGTAPKVFYLGAKR